MTSPWAAPESSAPQPSAGPQIELGSAAEVAALDGQVGPPAVPLDLEPHTILEILDGAFTIMRLQPAKVLALLAMAVLPINLFIAYMQRDVFASGGLFDAFEQGLDSNGEFATFAGPTPFQTALGWILPGVSLVMASAAISLLVAGWHSGRDPSVSEILGMLAKRWWQWPLAWVAVHVVELVAGLFLIFPGVYAMLMLVFTIPVMAVEGEKPIDAMKRSRALAQGAGGRVVTMVFTTVVLVQVISASLGVVPLLIASLVGESYGWVVQGLGSMLAAVLATGATAGSTLLLYFDLRVRREGLDLEMEALEHLAGAQLR